AQAVSSATRAAEAGLRRMCRLTRIFAGFSRVSDTDPSLHGEHAPNARRFDSRRLRRASLQDQVDLQDLVEGDGGVVDAAAGRLAIAAHRIEAIADRADRKP